jgi:hypothetical protein
MDKTDCEPTADSDLARTAGDDQNQQNLIKGATIR